MIYQGLMQIKSIDFWSVIHEIRKLEQRIEPSHFFLMFKEVQYTLPDKIKSFPQKRFMRGYEY